MHVPTLSRHRPALRRTIAPRPIPIGLAGALAGLGGGIAMTLIGALLMHALDQDQWLQLKLIAGCVLGAAASAQPGFAAASIALGALIRFGLAGLLGALFELAMRRLARWWPNGSSPELAGLAYGLLIWLVAYSVIIPLVSPLLLQIYAPALVVQHLVYGAVTGLVYAMLRPQPSDAAVDRR